MFAKTSCLCCGSVQAYEPSRPPNVYKVGAVQPGFSEMQWDSADIPMEIDETSGRARSIPRLPGDNLNHMKFTTIKHPGDGPRGDKNDPNVETTDGNPSVRVPLSNYRSATSTDKFILEGKVDDTSSNCFILEKRLGHGASATVYRGRRTSYIANGPEGSNEAWTEPIIVKLFKLTEKQMLTCELESYGKLRKAEADSSSNGLLLIQQHVWPSYQFKIENVRIRDLASSSTVQNGELASRRARRAGGSLSLSLRVNNGSAVTKFPKHPISPPCYSADSDPPRTTTALVFRPTPGVLGDVREAYVEPLMEYLSRGPLTFPSSHGLPGWATHRIFSYFSIVESASWLGEKMLNALEKLHKKGKLVHRDLKWENVLLRRREVQVEGKGDEAPSCVHHNLVLNVTDVPKNIPKISGKDHDLTLTDFGLSKSIPDELVQTEFKKSILRPPKRPYLINNIPVGTLYHSSPGQMVQEFNEEREYEIPRSTSGGSRTVGKPPVKRLRWALSPFLDLDSLSNILLGLLLYGVNYVPRTDSISEIPYHNSFTPWFMGHRFDTKTLLNLVQKCVKPAESSSSSSESDLNPSPIIDYLTEFKNSQDSLWDNETHPSEELHSRRKTILKEEIDLAIAGTKRALKVFKGMHRINYIVYDILRPLKYRISSRIMMLPARQICAPTQSLSVEKLKDIDDPFYYLFIPIEMEHFVEKTRDLVFNGVSDHFKSNKLNNFKSPYDELRSLMQDMREKNSGRRVIFMRSEENRKLRGEEARKFEKEKQEMIERSKQLSELRTPFT